MTCFFCKGTMKDDFTTYMTDTDKCVIAVRGVPCLKCDQCGETSYTGLVFKRLESIIDTLRNTLTEIAVVQYSNEAA